MAQGEWYIARTSSVTQRIPPSDVHFTSRLLVHRQACLTILSMFKASSDQVRVRQWLQSLDLNCSCRLLMTLTKSRHP